MDYKEIKTKGEAELEKTLNEKREAFRVLRFALAGSKSKNVREGREIRKTIARILTEKSSRANVR